MPAARTVSRKTGTHVAAALRRVDALGPKAWAAVLSAVAVVVRLPVIFTSTSYADSDYLDIYTDTLVYVDISDDLVSGRGFEGAGNYRTGGYPLFLTLLRPLPGEIYDTTAVVQHVLGVLLVAAIVLVAWRYFGRATSLIAGGLAAISPLMIPVEHAVLPDFLFGVLIFAGTVCLSEAVRRAVPSTKLLVATGLLFGIAANVKPAGQALIVAAPLALGFATRDLRRTLKGTAVVSVALIATLLPWMARNAINYGSPEMSIQGRHALFLRVFDGDKLPIPTDTAEGRFAKRVYDRTYERGATNSYTTVYEALKRSGRSSEEAIDIMAGLAWKAIRSDPGTYVRGTFANLQRHLSAIGATGTTPSFDDSRQFADDRLATAGTPLPRRLATFPWRLARIMTKAWWIASLNAYAALLLLFVRDVRRNIAGAFLAVWLSIALATSFTNAVEPRFALQLGALVFIMASAGAVFVVDAVLGALRRVAQG
jgi:4-amino-4-deoxy-L-arabinose transferase-like glycosyltransferase